MIKRVRACVCDICETLVRIPELYSIREVKQWNWTPSEWEKVGKLHMCPKCYKAYCAAVLRVEGENGLRDL